MKVKDVDIIIIAGGKCGSTTLLKTFQQAGFKTIKTHSRSCFINQFGYDGLNELIKSSSKNKKLFIIDSYRTPIERKISSFFENIDKHNYRNKSCCELIKIFNKDHINTIEEYHYVNILMKEYHIEPFSKFNFNDRFVMKKSGNIYFIKILFKDIANWGNILSNIFQKKINIYSGNLTKNKSISKLYEEFKLNYKFSDFYIKNILKKDKQFQIFNTPEEQEKYISKWKNN